VADVPVRLILDQARYAPGASGRVRVQIGANGYLLVLYAQPDGHVAIAYPLDPATPDRVQADTEIEIRSRGDRPAFAVLDSSGTGTWYAAISDKPYRFESLTLNGHWDYRAVPRAENPATVEADLTTFVESVAAARFDYDIVDFVIDTAAALSSSSSSSSADAAPASSGPPAVGPTGPWEPGPWSIPGRWWPGWPGPWWWGPSTYPGPYYDRAAPGAVAAGAGRLSPAAAAPPGGGLSAPSEARGHSEGGSSPHHSEGSGGGGGGVGHGGLQ
jgi:hypothetical protein